MNGCDGVSWNESEIATRVKQKGEIRVATLRHPLVDEVRHGGRRKGLERELLQNFADTYGLKIIFLTHKSEKDILKALQAGEVDLGAARLWAEEHRRHGLRRGPVFEESPLSLFCRRRLKIQHVSDLKDRRVSLLQKDNVNRFDERLLRIVPGVQVTVSAKDSVKSLMENLQKAKTDCVLAENIDGSFHARLSSTIEKIETPMTAPMGLAWYAPPDRSDLVALLHAWFQRASRNDEILRIQDHHRAHLSQLDHRDAHRFLLNIRQKLPSYRRSFQSAAKEHNLDWKLVAAVAYQESHWNPEARSFTGVRGMMQLTQATAAAVGIQDRTDPDQSIWGGSFYLRFLLNRMPRHLDAQERQALALAAYNSGIGNLKSAQALATARGLNPYAWKDLKKVFPLLEDPDIAAAFPHGVARGRETVEFVERVRGFHSLLRLAI